MGDRVLGSTARCRHREAVPGGGPARQQARREDRARAAVGLMAEILDDHALDDVELADLSVILAWADLDTPSRAAHREDAAESGGADHLKISNEAPRGRTPGHRGLLEAPQRCPDRLRQSAVAGTASEEAGEEGQLWRGPLHKPVGEEVLRVHDESPVTGRRPVPSRPSGGAWIHNAKAVGSIP